MEDGEFLDAVEVLIDHMNEITFNNALSACQALEDGAFLAELQKDGYLPEDSEDNQDASDVADYVHDYFRSIVEDQSVVAVYSKKKGKYIYLILPKQNALNYKGIEDAEEILSLFEIEDDIPDDDIEVLGALKEEIKKHIKDVEEVDSHHLKDENEFFVLNKKSIMPDAVVPVTVLF